MGNLQRHRRCHHLFALVMVVLGFVLLLVSSVRSCCGVDDRYFVSLGRWPPTFFDDHGDKPVSIIISDGSHRHNDLAGRRPELRASVSSSRQRSFLSRLTRPFGRRRRRPTQEAVNHLGLQVPEEENADPSGTAAPRTKNNYSIFSRLRRRAAPNAAVRPRERAENSVRASDASDARLQHILDSVSNPIIPEDVWEELTGHEFQEHPECIDRLASVGERLASQPHNFADHSFDEWVDWRAHQSDQAQKNLEDGDILLWTGKSRQSGHGISVPWVKTQSIVPLTPLELKELLLDSSRVKAYNGWSLGRDDCWTSPTDFENTKIVKNRTQPPIGSKPLVSITMMHARPATTTAGGSSDGWLVVSRAVGGKAFWDEKEDEGSGRTDMLMGVNLLEPHGDDSCRLTAITQVYTSSVPSMLAERLSVKGAIKFIKDIRNLKVAVTAY